jgi:ferredoxin-thioredoxin reductase catalytic subunit
MTNIFKVTDLDTNTTFNYVTEKEDYYLYKNADEKHCEKIKEGLVKRSGHCPCQLEDTPDTMCQCKLFKDMTEDGACHCNLFYKKFKK